MGNVSPASPLPGPVVVGGVGGSGTRVVAQILIDLKYYMGSHLNRSLDNLWFPFLLRNPHWFQAAADHAPQQIIQRLKLLEKAMTGQITPTPGEIALTVRAVAGFLRHRDDTMPEPDTIKNALALLRSRRTDLSAYRGWGWKAPNSQILIDYLPQVFPALIYIQAIRHGLDMAYSTNKRQLRLWGPMFGIDVPEDDHLLPRAALEYWVASNRATIEHGTRLLGDRFYLLNFDQLCADPPTEIARLLAVLSINPGSVDVAHLCSLPQTPSSVGRYKDHDLSIHRSETLAAVRDWGFQIE